MEIGGYLLCPNFSRIFTRPGFRKCQTRVLQMFDPGFANNIYGSRKFIQIFGFQYFFIIFSLIMAIFSEKRTVICNLFVILQSF